MWTRAPASRAAVDHRTAPRRPGPRPGVPTLGNRAGTAMLARRVADEPAGASIPTVPVTSPTGRVELQADQVASEVEAGVRDDTGHVPSAAGLAARAVSTSPPPLPPPIGPALVGGQPLSATDRAPLEAALGADLSAVTVHTGPAAALATESVGARAFTVGSAIVLGAGESTDDVGLLAHEATHALQGNQQLMTNGVLLRQQASEPEPEGLIEDDSWLPASIIDGVTSAAHMLPGYDVVCLAVGHDLITGDRLTVDAGLRLEQVLAEGPFGDGVAVVLQACEVIGSIVELVSAAMATHRITVDRVFDDVARAWDEMDVSEGIDGNVAIAARYVRAFIADVVAAIGEIVDRVLALVREAVVDLVEPLLTGSELGPVWRLFCKVIRHDPLRGVDVEASTVEIMADFLHLIGEDEALVRMTENGTLQRTADWVDTQLATFEGLLVEAKALFLDAWQAISPANLPSLLDTLPGLADRALALGGRVLSFAGSLLGKVIELVKDALLVPLSNYAHQIPGYRLLTVVLGVDPITGRNVERTAEALIGGFIALLPGGEQTYAELAESGVIGGAAAQIETAMTELGISFEMVTGLITDIWNGLSLADLADPIGCFVRIVQQFGDPLSRLVSFAATVVRVVVELILQLMHFPTGLLGDILSGIVESAEAIAADPVRFLNTMIAALKQGFSAFFDNILTHLVSGLAAWLFRGLGNLGIAIPTEITGESILTLVAEVLGLDMELVWERLGVQIGPERVDAIRGGIDRLTGAWEFVKDVQERGFAAIWEFVVDRLSSLWDMILSAAQDWIVTTVIERAVARVLTMLDPTGVMAVVNSAVAFFDAVQSVIEYVTDILEIIKRYVDTLSAMARGDTTPAAEQLEGGLGAAIPVAIGFLANQVGLGDLPERIVAIIEGIRERVVAAIDWLIAQAVRLGGAVLGALGLGSGQDPGAADPDTAGADVPGSPTANADMPDGPPGSLTEADHPAFARSAGAQLLAALAADPERPPGELAREFAAAHEASLSQQLQPGIRLRYVIPPTQGYESFGFDVVIAPNTTVAHLVTEPTPDVPLESAPGIGDTQPYRGKPPSLFNGPSIHHMIAEHIIPFDLGREVWRVLGAVVPTRGGWQDREQMTIMIYRGAAKEKTHMKDDVTGRTERQISAAFANMPGMDEMALRVETARDAAEAGALGGRRRVNPRLEEQVRAVILILHDALHEAKDYCIARTNDGIRLEHELLVVPYAISNGDRRAEEAPVPDEDKVAKAAEAQIETLWEIFQQAALGRE